MSLSTHPNGMELKHKPKKQAGSIKSNPLFNRTTLQYMKYEEKGVNSIETFWEQSHLVND